MNSVYTKRIGVKLIFFGFNPSVFERSNARGKLRRSEAEGTNRRSLIASA